MKEDDYRGFNEIYRELAEHFGIEIAKEIYDRYRGVVVSFPINLYSKDYITECIVSEYDGTNEKELARKYGYTLNWIKHLVKGREKKVEKKK